MAAEVLGALAGAGLAYGLAPESGRDGLSFCLVVQPGLSAGQTFGYEAFFAALAVSAMLGILTDRRCVAARRGVREPEGAPADAVRLALAGQTVRDGRYGLSRWASTYAGVVLVAGLASGAATGGAFNPARRCGRPPQRSLVFDRQRCSCPWTRSVVVRARHSLAASVVSGCFDDAWIYWVAPLAGAIVGGLLLRLYEAYAPAARSHASAIVRISHAVGLMLPTHDAAGGPRQG